MVDHNPPRMGTRSVTLYSTCDGDEEDAVVNPGGLRMSKECTSGLSWMRSSGRWRRASSDEGDVCGNEAVVLMV